MKRWYCVPVLLLFARSAVAQPPAQPVDTQAMAARPLLVGDLPVGTVTVRVGHGSLSSAAVDVEVVATVTSPGGTSAKRTEKTKSDGRATFSGLPVGAEFHAEALVDGEQLRTAAFAIPVEGGARFMLLSRAGNGEDASVAAGVPANPHAGAHGHGGNLAEAAAGSLPSTSDPSVLRVSSSSKLLVDLREDGLAVMENLVLENTSDRIFRADQGGIAVPLPAGANNVETIEGGARLEMGPNSTLFLREAIPPSSSHALPVQARFGFLLSTVGESRITLRQPMPFGIESPVVLLPEEHHLTITAPGLQAMAPQTDDRAGRIQIFQLASVPRNGVLSIAVAGLPTRASLGRTIAVALVATLLLAVVVGWRRPRRAGQPQPRDLGKQRDRLFAELVEVERARRCTGADDAALAQRRAELVAAIAAMDGEPAGDADAASPAGKSA